MITIGMAVLAFLFVWLLVMYFREDETKHEGSLFLNLMPQHTKPYPGFCFGVIQKVQDSHGRYIVEFSPRDIDNAFMKDKKDIPNVKVVIDHDKFITLSKHTLSDRRPLVIGLPPRPEDFKKELKGTEFGRAIMALTEQISTDNVQIKILREGSNRKNKLLLDLGTAEISNAWMERIEESVKSMIALATKEQKNQPGQASPTFQSPRPF